MCYGELTPYALQNTCSSVLRWLQKQVDDEDQSQTAALYYFCSCSIQILITYLYIISKL